MAHPDDVDWLPCEHEAGCDGVRLTDSDYCWAHTVDDQIVQAALSRIRDHGIEAMGVPVTSVLLERLLAAADRDDAGHAVLVSADFRGADFQDRASFTKVSFGGNANFTRARFLAGGDFDGAVFAGCADFTGAKFLGENIPTTEHSATSSDGENIPVVANFKEAVFQGDALFVWFSNELRDPRWGQRWGATVFDGDANFDDVTFAGWAVFEGAHFRGNAWFREVLVEREVSFHAAGFKGEASFNGAVFNRARQLGPLFACQRFDLDHTVFAQRCIIEVIGTELCCQHTRFHSGAQLRVRYADVVLDNADFGASSTFTCGSYSPVGWPGAEWEHDVTQRLATRTDNCPGQRNSEADSPDPMPRLLSVRGANVAALTITGVDLSACEFRDAQGLDQLRLSNAVFASSPRTRRWTPRQTLAEEHGWRAYQWLDRREFGYEEVTEAGSAAVDFGGWYGPDVRPSEWWLHLSESLSRSQEDQLEPAAIADIYRALRKAREDAKDEPGAADFYYGEMEMRRHDPTTPAAERYVLFLYWLLSGYGLRASRALIALGVILILASGVFAFWGFAPPETPAIQPVDITPQGQPIYRRTDVEQPTGWDQLPTGALFSAQASTALLRGPDRPLTTVGEWLHILLRLVGPTLLGLALLSIRGRVKR